MVMDLLCSAGVNGLDELETARLLLYVLVHIIIDVHLHLYELSMSLSSELGGDT
jgi:hypothetical protein